MKGFCIAGYFLLVEVGARLTSPGGGSRSAGGSIAITANREADQLHIRVADDGVCAGEPRERIGLANTRARVEQFFGRLTFASSPAGGAVVEIFLPFRTA